MLHPCFSTPDLFTVCVIFAFSRMPYSWTHTAGSLSDHLLSRHSIWVSSVSFLGLMDDSFLIYCQMVPRFVDTFTYWRMSSLLPDFGYCEWRCYKHHTSVQFHKNTSFHSCGHRARSVTLDPLTTVCVFSFLRNHQAIFQRGCAVLNFHWQWMRIPFVPIISRIQHYLSPVFGPFYKVHSCISLLS